MVRAGRLPQPVPWSLPCAPEEKVNFSVDHMSMSNSFHANQYVAENIPWEAYLAAWQGPVYGEGRSVWGRDDG